MVHEDPFQFPFTRTKITSTDQDRPAKLVVEFRLEYNAASYTYYRKLKL